MSQKVSECGCGSCFSSPDPYACMTHPIPCKPPRDASTRHNPIGMRVWRRQSPATVQGRNCSSHAHTHRHILSARTVLSINLYSLSAYRLIQSLELSACIQISPSSPLLSPPSQHPVTLGSSAQESFECKGGGNGGGGVWCKETDVLWAFRSFAHIAIVINSCAV